MKPELPTPYNNPNTLLTDTVFMFTDEAIVRPRPPGEKPPPPKDEPPAPEDAPEQT